LNIYGGTAAVVSATRKTISTSALSITGPTGKLDLGRSNLLTSGVATAAIRGDLASAFTANQDWSGTTGITSSLAIGNPVIYTVGYADGNDQSAQDAGVAVAPGQVLVRPSLVGDANLDG